MLVEVGHVAIAIGLQLFVSLGRKFALVFKLSSHHMHAKDSGRHVFRLLSDHWYYYY